MKIINKCPNIVSREYDDFAILYNLEIKNYVLLNSVGSDIWKYITSRSFSFSFDDILSYISDLYEEPIAAIYEDIQTFINELFNDNMIQINGISYFNPSAPSNPIAINDIEGEIISIMRERNQLYSVTFELTYTCNEKCIHCYATYPNSKTPKRTLDLATCKNIIDELYEMQCFHLCFTGGDPFLFDGFIELLTYAREKEFVFDIYTNALALTNTPQYIEQIKDLFPRTFYISVYGSTAQTHDSITQIEGSFNKTLNAIKVLRNANIRIVLNIMIMKPNYHELSSIIELSTTLDVDYRIGMSIISKNNGDSTPLEYFIDDTKIIEDILLSINKDKLYNMDTQLNNPQNHDLICGAGTTALCISPDGEVYPCVSLKTSLGTIFKSSIKDLWNNENRLEFVNSLTWENTTNCKSCELYSYCSHCIGISHAENSNAMHCNNCDYTIAQSLYNVTNGRMSRKTTSL